MTFIGRHPELKNTSGYGPHFEFWVSVDIGPCGSAIFKPAMVENVRVAIGIALLALSVQKLFPLPIS